MLFIYAIKSFSRYGRNIVITSIENILLRNSTFDECEGSSDWFIGKLKEQVFFVCL